MELEEGKTQVSKYEDDMLQIWEQYQQQVSPEPIDLKEAGAWARARGLWAPRPIDMAEVLRAQKRVDKDGREYRAFIPARTKGKDGLPLFQWADIDVAPRSHVEKGIQGERRSIANDCFALAMKVEHYNATHPSEERIQIPFNFEEDIEEMKISRGLSDEAA